MEIRTPALVVVLAGTVWGCGGTSDPADSTVKAVRTAPSDAEDAVDRALIDTRAGFDAAKAAGMLGVAAAELEVQEGFVERLGGQSCRYWSAASRVGPGLQFLLNVRDSGAEAARALGSQRELVPAVDPSAAGGTGQGVAGPARVEFDGIGDEAFWDTNTGGVNVRVRNVIATIHGSTSSNSMSDRDPGQIGLERRVAEEVARGLGGG